MISVLAFNFGDMSSNPAEAYIFLQNLCLKRTKINKKRPGFAKLKKWLLVTVLICRSDGQTVLDRGCELVPTRLSNQNIHSFIFAPFWGGGGGPPLEVARHFLD